MGGGGTEGFAHTTTVAQDSEGYREKKSSKPVGTPQFWKDRFLKVLQSHPCCTGAGGHLGKRSVQTLVGGRNFMVCL